MNGSIAAALGLASRGRSHALLAVLALGLGLAVPTADTNEIPGISGMAPIDGESYLIVIDTKANKKGPRLGLLEILPAGTNRFTALRVETLDKGEQRASDLEAIHRIPGRAGEYLACESGRRATGPGRVFHLAFDPANETVSVLASWPLPERVAESSNWALGEGDNYEGLACLPLGKNRFQLVLGQRGGSLAHPRGSLVTGLLDLTWGLLDWLPAENDVAVVAPGKWNAPRKRRDVADLYFDERDDTLWCASSEDHGDRGPFRSILWPIGTVTPTAPDSGLRWLDTEQTPAHKYVVDGHKVEALSAGARSIPNTLLSFGAEDEDYGGTWRPLCPPVE